MDAIVEQAKSLELKKHVGAIHSSNHLTLVQRKLANALLYNAYDSLLEEDEHQIHIKALCELIGYNSKDYKKIKRALVALISTVIEWNLVDKERFDKEGIWNASAMLADASIDGPICSYSYSKKMIQLLYRPEIYARVNMRVLAQFKSTYGIALYENCIRYQNIAQTPWFDMPTFKKLMGVEEGKYAIFRDFKRRVLDKAITEVNKYSPIFIAVKLKKKGREVVTLRFLIEQSKKALVDNSCLRNAGYSLSKRLRDDYGFSKSQVKHALSVYDENYILEKISIIEASPSYQSGKIINLAKYLNSALEQDYQSVKSSKDKFEEQKKVKGELDKLKRLKEKRIKQYRIYQNKEILKACERFKPSQKILIEQEFEKYIQPTVYYNLFLKNGLKNQLVIDRMCDFVKSHRKELLADIMSFDDFCQLDPSEL